jgi:hypothetical protein
MYILRVFAFLFVACLANAQEQNKAYFLTSTPYIIEKEKGCVLVCNNYFNSGINFYLPVNFNISTSSREGIFIANNKALQIFIINAGKFSAQNNYDKILEYIKYECDYVAETFGEKLTHETEKIKSKKRNEVIFWYFLMPKNAQAEVTHQLFINFIYNDYIFSISSPLFKDDKLEETKNFLLSLIEYIVFSDKKITWEVLKKSIK